ATHAPERAPGVRQRDGEGTAATGVRQDDRRLREVLLRSRDANLHRGHRGRPRRMAALAGADGHGRQAAHAVRWHAGAGQRGEPREVCAGETLMVFELEWRGGATAARLHKRRPGGEALPWGTIDLARYPELHAIEARKIWSNGVFTEYASAAAFA